MARQLRIRMEAQLRKIELENFHSLPNYLGSIL